MKLICAQSDFDFATAGGGAEVVLYGHSDRPTRGSAGASAKDEILRQKLNPAPRAWDFLSIALSVMAADLAGRRDKSPDGWTRELELHIAVADKKFWDTQINTVEKLLSFLTTDRWRVAFLDGGFLPAPERNPTVPDEDCIVLVSGGLDSFTGVLDLVAGGQRPYAVSQLVRGDAEMQTKLASIIGGGLRHLQLNHNTVMPDAEEPPTQRARSIIFFAYGILAATTLTKYRAGEEVTLNVCENGFITLNPPLTDFRIGSLSTRTCHPVVIALLQKIADAAALRVHIKNPYRLLTKGEILGGCKNQILLRSHAHETTSCGRFKRFGYKHCGRCIPCLIRRASFHAWNTPDATEYVHRKLSIQDKEHAGFDDVRAAAMAALRVKQDGLDRWLGATLTSGLIEATEIGELKAVAARGMAELAEFLDFSGVQ